MKKNLLYILIILMIPLNAYAYELKCEEGPIDYNSSFNCYIKGDNAINYDELSGNIELEKDSKFTCEAIDLDNGLSRVDSESDFSYKGTSSSEELVLIKCTVTTKTNSTGDEQIIIPNFKYHALDDNNDASTEVLRSNKVKYNSYIEPPKVTDTKPRNTDNPDSRIKDLKEPNLDFVFSTFKTEYDISVKYEVDKISPVITPTNQDAIIEIIGSYDLSIGNNVIDIYVTSPDGAHQTCYTLNINRLKRGEEVYYIEKDSSLSSLSIEGYNINFESIVHEYNIRINYNVDSINVKAEATNPNAEVRISNTSGLKNGDVINVTVTSQDKSISTIYSIKINKNAAPKDNRSTIIIVVLAVSIAFVIGLILYTNYKNKLNPLLRIKKPGKKLDKSLVPDAGQKANVIENTPVTEEKEKIETLNVQTTQEVQQTTIPVEQSAPVTQAVPTEQVTQVVPVQQPVQEVQQVSQPQQVPVQPVAPVVQEQPVAQTVPVQPVVSTPTEPVVQASPVQPVQQAVETFEVKTEDVMNANIIQTADTTQVVSNNQSIPTPPPAPVIEEHKETVETNIFN